MAAGPRAPTIETYIFAGDGIGPNNPRLPLILYRGALETGGDGAASCVALFDRNGWTGAWKNGVYAHITITAPHMRCWASLPVGSA